MSAELIPKVTFNPEKNGGLIENDKAFYSPDGYTYGSVPDSAGGKFGKTYKRFVKGQNPHETVLEFDVFHATKCLDVEFSYKVEIRLTYNAGTKAFSDYTIDVAYGANGGWEDIVDGKVAVSSRSQTIADFFVHAAKAIANDLIGDLCKELSQNAHEEETQISNDIMVMFSSLPPGAKAKLLQELSAQIKEDGASVDDAEVAGAAAAAAAPSDGEETKLLGTDVASADGGE